MQIVIFKSSKNKSSSYKFNILLFISIIVIFVISLSFLFSSASYMYGYEKGYRELNDDRAQDISDYENSIKLIKNEHNDKIKYFSLKLTNISSELNILNSLGNKLTKIAKLNKKDFNFSNPKYIGGKDKVKIEFDYESDFDKYLDGMLVNLASKKNELIYIDKIITNMEMKEQFFPSGLPSLKGYISSQYGTRINPLTKKKNFHKGVDIAHKIETDIRVLAAGEVTYSGKKYGYGNLIEVSHINGYKTRYAHNNRNLVKVGEFVKKEQIIGKMGSTGHSTGPHVHLEVLKNNKHIDPNKFIHYKNKFISKESN